MEESLLNLLTLRAPKKEKGGHRRDAGAARGVSKKQRREKWGGSGRGGIHQNGLRFLNQCAAAFTVRV